MISKTIVSGKIGQYSIIAEGK